MNKITVFTATYNRAHTIDKLYQSLTKQTYKNFEWIVVDDGSIDNTQEVLNNYIIENIITIKLIKQKNGGKHRAINKGLDYSEGNLFFIVDSDDYIIDTALEKINEWENTIENGKFAGIVGLKGYNLKNAIGTTFKGENKDILIYNRKQYNITGDKAEIYYTDILKKYRFSEYNNENFLTEATVWNRIALDGYVLRYFNDIICVCKYLEDGLTCNINMRLKENPKGFLEYVKQLLLINKSSFIGRVHNISYYYFVVQNLYTKDQICKQLGISRLFLTVSIAIRKIFKG